MRGSSSLKAIVFAAASALFAVPALAGTVWTDWTSGLIGAPGFVVGTLDGVGVRYDGQVTGGQIGGTSLIWSPDSSFIGGTSTTSPSTVGDEIDLNGSYTGVNTITFASPIVDPLIAIWSLGQPGLSASFNFFETPTFEAGGPNAQYGGAAITVLGNVVSGNEGNGVVQFTGTFSSISWTNTPENYYAFTVGVANAAPEPATLALLGMGLAGLGFARRKRH